MNTSGLLQYEEAAWSQGYQNVLFIDEAGRGCLFGPVCVAGVMYRAGSREEDLPAARDSKTLSQKRREILFDEIVSKAAVTKIVLVSAEEVDRHNILQATLMGMKEIIQNIDPPPDYVYIDGNRIPKIDGNYSIHAVPKLDSRSISCASASILAKTYRDRHVEQLVRDHPELEKYGLLKHHGYPTLEHRQALTQYGLTPMHRQTFRWKRCDE
jgi:ribonuclease HII